MLAVVPTSEWPSTSITTRSRMPWASINEARSVPQVVKALMRQPCCAERRLEAVRGDCLTTAARLPRGRRGPTVALPRGGSAQPVRVAATFARLVRCRAPTAGGLAHSPRLPTLAAPNGGRRAGTPHRRNSTSRNVDCAVRMSDQRQLSVEDLPDGVSRQILKLGVDQEPIAALPARGAGGTNRQERSPAPTSMVPVRRRREAAATWMLC